MAFLYRGASAVLAGCSSQDRHPLGLAPGERPVWFHGVSVGEVHLLLQVVAAFRKRHPRRACVLSTTTDTGLAEAHKWFPDLPVFVFSWAVRRTLGQVKLLDESDSSAFRRIEPNSYSLCRTVASAHATLVIMMNRASVCQLSGWLLVFFKRMEPPSAAQLLKIVAG